MIPSSANYTNRANCLISLNNCVYLQKARLVIIMKHRNSLETYNRWLFKINTNNYITMCHASLIKLTGVVVLSIAVAILLGTMTLQAANAQNSINSNIGTTKTPAANGSNKTVVIAAPGAAATVVTTGNKTIITTATPTPTISKSTTANFNRTGFTNLYVLTSPAEKTFPIRYNIKGGKLVGLLEDKDITTLALVLNPSAHGGNFTVELARNVIDSKGASNADSKYQIKIDGKGVDYKEVANNVNARILSIDFSKDDRFIEISATRMTS
jgi:hypothetical protein